MYAYSKVRIDGGEIHRLLDDLIVIRNIVLFDIYRFNEVVTALVFDQLVHNLLQFLKCLVPLLFTHHFLDNNLIFTIFSMFYSLYIFY